MALKKILSSGYRTALVLLAISGLVIMIYLTYLHYSGSESFCDISETVSCDIVTTSIYSEVFGIPVSLLGMFFFALILYILARDPSDKSYRTVALVTVFGLIPSLYLSLTELFFIDAFCPLCESSKAIMVAILVVAIFAAGKQKKTAVTMRILTPIIIAGLLASGITYFAQTGTVVQRDNTALVACLNEKGVTYYKSVRCNNCKRQERLLGDAYLNLNSVECHPDGEHAQPELCLEKGVDKTPTFILEPEGEELDRLVGLQQLEDLAAFVSCEEALEESVPVTQ